MSIFVKVTTVLILKMIEFRFCMYISKIKATSVIEAVEVTNGLDLYIETLVRLLNLKFSHVWNDLQIVFENEFRRTQNALKLG